MPSNPFPERQKAVSLKLKKYGVSALLVTNLQNIRYLTGCQLSAGALLIDARTSTLFLDARYREAGRSLSWQRVEDLSLLAAALVSVSRVGFEADVVSVARLSLWKKKYRGAKFIQTTGLIEKLRATKDRHEILAVKRAIAITKKVLASVPSLLQRGISENDVAYAIDTHARRLGAESMAFDTIVAFGSNTSRPHHHPSDRRLKAGDIVQVDMGVKVHGYCSDMSRVFFTGPKLKSQAKAYRALQEAKKAAEENVRPGVSTQMLDRIARQVLKTYGYDKEFCHSLGHGLGLDIHEAPTLSMKAPKHVLQKHEIITIEPGLYFEGEWGMRIEDTIIVE